MGVAATMAVISAHCTPAQVRLLSWYCYDGMDQHDIAEMLGISQQAVSQQIDTVLRLLDRIGVPRPKRLEHPTATRSVRTVELDWL
jgi:hypothetical protein